MRKLLSVIVLLILVGGSSRAQQPAVISQTPRQALLEMFFSKASGTFVKHVPATTLAALEKSGAMASLQQYSIFTAQLETQQSNLKTFETGSVLLSGQNPQTGEKIEIMVVNDTLRGDRDDIELSFQTYKNGAPEHTAFMPQLTFTMKREAQIWKLNEMSITIHLPLADPDFLKAVTEKMKPQMSAQPQVQVQPTTFAQQHEPITPSAGSDETVISAMRTILSAEATYAQSYANVGYTCMLSDLDGFGGGEPNAHQAMLINSGLASGKRFGFVFTLTGCSGAPAKSFRLMAAPGGTTFGRKTFCADQSGAIRASESGTPERCFANGTPIQ
jgi:hypothetical protein